MKKTFLLFSLPVLLLLMFSFVSAQTGDDKDKLKWTSLTANMGQGAFTSGFDVTTMFESDTGKIEITANHERFYGVYFWKLPMKIKAGICAGAFKNMPQTGPYVVFSPIENLSAFYWRGWGFGEPGKPKTEINHFFESVGGMLTLGNLKISYVYINFLGEKTSLPGVCYSLVINKKFKFFTGIDYKVSEKKPLYRIGLTFLSGE